MPRTTALPAEIAGTLVNPKGMAKKMTANVAGGVVGGMAGRLATGAAVGHPYAGVPAVPDFGRVGYLAVDAERVVLAKTRTGAFKMKVTDEILVSAPRAAVAEARLESNRSVSHLTIAMRDGAVWEFDVPRANRSAAEALLRELGGVIA